MTTSHGEGKLNSKPVIDLEKDGLQDMLYEKCPSPISNQVTGPLPNPKPSYRAPSPIRNQVIGPLLIPNQVTESVSEIVLL